HFMLWLRQSASEAGDRVCSVGFPALARSSANGPAIEIVREARHKSIVIAPCGVSRNRPGPALPRRGRNRSEFLRGLGKKAPRRQVRPRARGIASLPGEQAAGNVHPSPEPSYTVRNLILMSPHRPSFED